MVRVMIKTFSLSQQVKNAYRVNSILFSLQQIPLVKKLLPSTLYQSVGLKIFATIVSMIVEISNIFFTKPLYLVLMIFLPSYNNQVFNGDTFIHIFLFLTILGTCFNSHFFEASKHKYYAISLLKMDARKYVLSNAIYFSGKIIIGFLSTTVLLGLLFDINMIICVLMPFFTVSAKMIFNAYTLYKTEKTQKVFNEDKPTPLRWVIWAVCVAFAYAPLFAGISINQDVFVWVAIATIIGGIPSVIYIWKFKGFTILYKQLLSTGGVIFNIEDTIAETNKKEFGKIIENLQVETNKKGYAYLHEIFVKRHRKLLMRAAKNLTIIIFAAVVAALVGVFAIGDFSQQVNEFTLTFLPYCLFIMFYLNRGQAITRIMFANCDCSMLSYKFYRQPKAVLELFTKRLKTVVGLNLMPASVMAIGLPLLLYCSGGTDNVLNYFVLFASIIAMSVFFSTHSLILYYLLQPYNKETKVKSGTYNIVNMITAVVVFSLMNTRLPTLWFGVCSIVFMVLYIFLAVFLVYRFAPKTFKLR